MDRELARSLVETGDGAAGLDRLSAGTRPAQVALDHVGGLREFLLDRPECIVAMLGDIVGAALGMQHRVALGIDRVHHVGHGRQRLVVDADESRGVFGDVARIGDDQHYRLAHMTHLAERDASLLDRRIGEARQRLSFLRRILTANHDDDAGQSQRRGLVDRFDPRVGVRAAQHCGMRLVG